MKQQTRPHGPPPQPAQPAAQAPQVELAEMDGGRIGGRSLHSDRVSSRLAYTSRHILRRSWRLQYLRPDSPKSLGGRNDRQVPSQGPPQNQAGQYEPPPPPAQPAAPAPLVGIAVIHAHVEEIMHDTFGTEARPAIRPVFMSPYLVRIDTDYLYRTNWKMPKFDKFSGEENEITNEHIARFMAQCCEAAAASLFLKMRLFITLLTKTAFS